MATAADSVVVVSLLGRGLEVYRLQQQQQQQGGDTQSAHQEQRRDQTAAPGLQIQVCTLLQQGS